MQSSDQRQELVTYVIDRFGLKLTEDQSSKSTDTRPYADLALWRYFDLRYFVGTRSSNSTLGKSAKFGVTTPTEYAAFSAAIIMQRTFEMFILKTLMPMFLLMIVVFATLFFPPSLLKEQITLPVTGILTSAVLMVSMNNQLPDTGYVGRSNMPSMCSSRCASWRSSPPSSVRRPHTPVGTEQRGSSISRRK